MSTPHTPGPWRIQAAAPHVIDSDTLKDIAGCCAHVFRSEMDHPVDLANARRIVECVNALEGIDNPAEYIKLALSVGIEAFNRQKQNTKLRDALQGMVDAFDQKRGLKYDNWQIDAVNDAHELLTEIRMAEQEGGGNA